MLAGQPLADGVTVLGIPIGFGERPAVHEVGGDVLVQSGLEDLGERLRLLELKAADQLVVATAPFPEHVREWLTESSRCSHEVMVFMFLLLTSEAPSWQVASLSTGAVRSAGTVEYRKPGAPAEG